MGKSNTADNAAAQAQLAQSQQANKLIKQSDPTRQLLFNSSNEFLSGGGVFGLPQYASVKDSIESQYGRARDNIIGGTAEGGGLTSALGNLEQGRASDLTQGAGALAEGETNRALQLATGGTALGTSALGTAGSIAAQRAAAEAEANAGKAGGTGQAAGTILASIITKSDRRLKKNIHQMGVIGRYRMYSYDWIHGGHGVGVMADEVPCRIMGSDGFWRVDYSRLLET